MCLRVPALCGVIRSGKNKSILVYVKNWILSDRLGECTNYYVSANRIHVTTVKGRTARPWTIAGTDRWLLPLVASSKNRRQRSVRNRIFPGRYWPFDSNANSVRRSHGASPHPRRTARGGPPSPSRRRGGGEHVNRGTQSDKTDVKFVTYVR